MVEDETSSSVGNADFGFVEELTISVICDAVWGPVEAVFMEAILRTESNGRRAEELISWDAIIGVNNEQQVGFFIRVLVKFGEEFHIDFALVAFVLMVALALVNMAGKQYKAFA